MRTSNKILLGFFVLILLTITIIIIKFGVDVKDGSLPESDNKSGQAEKQKELAHFNKIEIEGNFIVHYTQDTFQKVTIRADSNLVDKVLIEVHYDRLFIHSKRHFRSRQHIDVYVTNDSINEIESRAGSSFKTINTLKVYQIDISSEAGSKIELNGNINNLNIELSAGSVADFTGTCKNLDVKSSAGAVLNADNLVTDICRVSSSAGSVNNINVNGELSIEASSGSIIKCQGNPQIKSMDISSGARFIK
jgi:hypothetical protein